MPGSPMLRTAKSSWRGNISTRIGPWISISYNPASVSSASCASVSTYSPRIGASDGCRRTMRSPRSNVSNSSSVSIISSRLYVMRSNGSSANDRSSAARAPGSSPVRSRCMPSSACARLLPGSISIARRTSAAASSKRYAWAVWLPAMR